MITTEELINWLQQDTTKYFLKSLYNQREILKEQLVVEMRDVTTANFLRGKITVIQRIIDTDAEQIMRDFTNTLEKYYTEEEKLLLKP